MREAPVVWDSLTELDQRRVLRRVAELERDVEGELDRWRELDRSLEDVEPGLPERVLGASACGLFFQGEVAGVLGSHRNHARQRWVEPAAAQLSLIDEHATAVRSMSEHLEAAFVRALSTCCVEDDHVANSDR